MEKLIELLNGHAHTYADHYDDTGEEIVIDFYKHTDQCFLYTEDGQFESLVDDVVISKRFGFIKRLIENDKIDIEKLQDKDAEYSFHYSFEDYEVLLMLLAIQDEPIEFLISMLK